MLIITFWFT